MKKDVVEGRVRLLLDKVCAYVYKPADGIHSGPVKLDFMACRKGGGFLTCEVKQTPNADYYNPHVKSSVGISELQWSALSAVAAGGGQALVAVWHGDECSIFDFVEMWAAKLWPWDRAKVTIPWNGLKDWQTWDLREWCP